LANEVTLAGLLLSAFGGLLIVLAPRASWPLILLPVILVLRTGMKTLDELLAREQGLRNELKASMNELADVLSDAVLYLPLAAVPLMPPRLVTVAVVLGVVAEMAGVVAAQLGGRRRYDGPMGMGERAVTFGGIALLLGLGAGNGPWLDIIMLVMIGLIALTMMNRIRGGMRDAGR
jgi:CDP-diacylglycerol--glycerol-3-phosphate 3-phosphatidyltransferase